MQAPKDGDSPEYLTELHGLQQRLEKRLEDPPEPQATGVARSSFVTSDCSPSPLAEAHRMRDAFTRGFVKGLMPLAFDKVRVDSHAQADATYYRLGEVGVRVSGLEMVQATDPEALGHAKGEALRRQAIGEGVGLPEKHWQPEPDTVPCPQVLGWSGGGSPEGGYGVVTIGIEGVAVRYVPESTRRASGTVDFDHWHASPYTRVYERQQRELHERLHAADMELSRILHEMAGEASLCWEPKPAGVFDSSAAIGVVERAIKELRAILRGA